MMKHLLMIMLVLLSGVTTAHSGEDFPLRANYPQVKPISTEQLAAEYVGTIIVDVRSKIEYDVVHINKALHIPVAQSNFLAELEKARGKHSREAIAFYCNGTTCAKSYKAAEQALDGGFERVFTYDAGIYAWVNEHPELATLMGQTPARREKLIPEDSLKTKQLHFAEFKARAEQPGAIVVDIREPFQRAKNPELPQNKMLALGNVRNIPSDRLVPLLEKKEFQDRPLLITDAVGKQVQWLQYYLEEFGYRDYAFLAGGVLEAAEAGGVR
jgi:rhodanese-related sulfurtransferase